MRNKNINKTLKYSIRKLAVGATPVVIGAFLLSGGTTAFATEGIVNNVSINYVADSELTDYEKSLVKQGIPEELKNGETYYLVYKNDAYRSNNKLPNTGSSSLPVKGIGFATALLTVVLVSKKNRNKILGIVLIGALGQSFVLPSSTFALENKLLAGYNHIASANTRFEDNLISIDGYKYVGYLTSEDLSLNSENIIQYRVQENISKPTTIVSNLDEEKVTNKQIEKEIEKPIEKDKEKPIEEVLEDKPQVKENLTDIVKNSDDNIPLPVVVEEVLSETTKEEEIEVSENENNNSSVEKDSSIEKNNNPKALSVNNATLENEKEKSQANINAPIEKSNSDESIIKEKANIKESKSNEENTTIKNNTVETPKNIQDTANSPKATTADTTNKTNSSLNKDAVKSTKVKKKVKVVERIIKVTETVPYKVVYEEDENMENGTTKVIKEGKVGEKTTIQKVLLHNGEELKREITSSTVKQKEVDKVIKVGTKGVKKHNSKPEINNDPQSAQKTKLIPKKETVYTEIVESKQRKYVKDYPKLEEATKDIKNNIGILTTQKDKLSTINITNIFDDSLFEGERRFENAMMYYVQANLKRKREFENKEEIIDNIISKEVPVITGVMRIGTRKPGFETLKGDGKLVNISSNLDEKEIKNIKLSNNNSYMLDKEVPGYLGSAINIDYKKDFKNTKLGLKFDVTNIKADSKPTIYNYDSKSQLLEEFKTEIIGDMAFASINKPGSYLVLDKKVQDEVETRLEKYKQNEIFDSPGTKNPVSETVGRSIVFAIDSSGSMSENDADGLRKTLTKELINQLDSSKDKLSIIDFDDEVQVSTALTNDFKSVEKDIENINSSGGTYIPDALKAGVNKLLEDKQSKNRKYIFVLTDGEDSKNPGNDYNQVIDKARKNNIAIYTIGLQNANQALLRRVADGTGGKFYFAQDATELPKIYEQIDNDIEFRSTDHNKDRISASYTREILKEKLLLGTKRPSPYFKKQIEIARNDISKKYNININDKDAINKIIDKIDEKELEFNYINRDYDKDILVNGEEVRPEINKEGNAFLYVLSDPENPDTDGDGIRDDRDKFTDFDNNNGIKLNLTSNTDDTDGDGYDDAFELNRGKVDSFGEKHLPDRWNIGHRDLLLFSDIVYYDFNNNYYGKSLKEIYDIAKERMKKDNKIFGSEVLYYLDLISKNKNNYDNEFFNKWKYIYRSTESYDISVNLNQLDPSIYSVVKAITKVYSDVMVFQNNNDFVITYRGTDEDSAEFITDGKILFNTDKVGYKAKEQFEKLKNALSFDTLKNKRIYVTGHSLGGYEAYYAFMKAKESYHDSIKGVINFNGPGIYNPRIDSLEYRQLLEEYRKNNNSVLSIRTDKGILNNAIVNAGGVFMHPNPQEKPLKIYNIEKLDINEAEKKELEDKIENELRKADKYPHELTSFYGSINQGRRNSEDKFISKEEIFYDFFVERTLKNIVTTVNKIEDAKKAFKEKVSDAGKFIKSGLFEGLKNIRPIEGSEPNIREKSNKY